VVVDDQLWVHGMAGLRVIDASIMPAVSYHLSAAKPHRRNKTAEAAYASPAKR
jgi:hypothetical protein